MEGNQPDINTTMRHLVEGYRVSQAIHVAATLGIADLLSRGSRTTDELAEATKTDAPTLYRLLRALATVEVVYELEARRFELTPLGQLLRSDVPGSIAAWAVFIGRPYHWQAWAALLHSVTTGENAFQHVHGTDPWTFRSARPQEGAIFDSAMRSLVLQSSTALLEAYDFGRFHRIVDVGGGNGALLGALLTSHPHLSGILFDQPHVVSGASTILERAGVAKRCRVVAGDFFDSVPSGADAYLLRHVIHDWDDAAATRILSTIRRAIKADGVLLLVERVVPGPNDGRDAKFSDLNMLVALGGRERTREEFGDLVKAAGFQLARMVSAGESSVLEATPT